MSTVAWPTTKRDIPQWTPRGQLRYQMNFGSLISTNVSRTVLIMVTVSWDFVSVTWDIGAKIAPIAAVQEQTVIMMN